MQLPCKFPAAVPRKTVQPGRPGPRTSRRGKRGRANAKWFAAWVASSSGVFGAWRWWIARAQDHRQGLPALTLPPVFGALRLPWKTRTDGLFPAGIRLQ